ncbi:acyl carrier protein [Streptomyces sp. MZ04]|uniref:acyl carrier protein n=1 Tax=Streptomyces sp. MZ04 TaxID=2559236 RepID=UPI00107E8D12|nr:acyl carrier protein [Streptomyces sp. MZ04]TGA92974.1 acyl carrier protein [Streptomyces sp. MZ04]
MTAPLPETTLADEDRARIKDVVCEVLDIEPEDITLTGSFTKDYAADSMALVALGASLERTFDIEIEDMKVDLMDDLENVFAVVGEALAMNR